MLDIDRNITFSFAKGIKKGKRIPSLKIIIGHGTYQPYAVNDENLKSSDKTDLLARRTSDFNDFHPQRINKIR